MPSDLFPVTSIRDLDRLPIVLLAYEAGSSGEFLASAITQSFDGFYRAEYHWENNWRCMFQDAFGRALSWGHVNIDQDLLLQKFNHLLMESGEPGQRYLATMHPRPDSSISFVREYFPSCVMIKITCHDRLSKQFRKLSCYHKLNSWDRDITHKLDLENEQGWVKEFTNPGLEIEWRDIILDHPAREFDRIQSLLGCQGNWGVFYHMLKDYVQRNREILCEIPVDQ